MVWSWGVQAESPESGGDCGRSTSTTEHDIMFRKLEHASPHSRGVILERVGACQGHGGAQAESPKSGRDCGRSIISIINYLVRQHEQEARTCESP